MGTKNFDDLNESQIKKEQHKTKQPLYKEKNKYVSKKKKKEKSLVRCHKNHMDFGADKDFLNPGPFLSRKMAESHLRVVDLIQNLPLPSIGPSLLPFLLNFW